MKTAVAGERQNIWFLEPRKVLIPVKASDRILLELDPEQVRCSEQPSTPEKERNDDPQRC